MDGAGCGGYWLVVGGWRLVVGGVSVCGKETLVDVVKQWRCRNDHVLGLVVQNGADVPQLLVYRHAIDADAETPAEVDVKLDIVTGKQHPQEIGRAHV